jgi:hypothetical protein
MSTPTAFLWQVEVGGGGVRGDKPDCLFSSQVNDQAEHDLQDILLSFSYLSLFLLSSIICFFYFLPLPFLFSISFLVSLRSSTLRVPIFLRITNAQTDYLYIIAPGAINDKRRKIREKYQFRKNPRTNKAALDTRRVDHPSF